MMMAVGTVLIWGMLLEEICCMQDLTDKKISSKKGQNFDIWKKNGFWFFTKVLNCKENQFIFVALTLLSYHQPQALIYRPG